MAMTYEEAEELVCEFYNWTWAQDDPDWWRDMIEAIREQPSVDAARAWLSRGGDIRDITTYQQEGL